jgi:hypothetical protein
MLVAAQAGLEYEDGTIANIDKGAWLHHMVMSNNAHRDTNCKLQGQRFFASGNERATRRMNSHGNWGYPIGATDQWSAIVELMNQASKSQEVYMTVRYETIPNSEASNYQKATPAWIDVSGGCGAGDVSAKTGSYKYSKTWVSTLEGPILEATGHQHDGGTDSTFYINGKQTCVSKQAYGARPQYVEKNGMADGMSEKRDAEAMTTPFLHISEQGTCQMMHTLKKGDVLKMDANYDSVVHPQMTGMPVMGIALMYVGTG